MGQHKYNPTAIKAKNNELPPKPKKPSKRETERWIRSKCVEYIYGSLYKSYKKLQDEEFHINE